MRLKSIVHHPRQKTRRASLLPSSSDEGNIFIYPVIKEPQRISNLFLTSAKLIEEGYVNKGIIYLHAVHLPQTEFISQPGSQFLLVPQLSISHAFLLPLSLCSQRKWRHVITINLIVLVCPGAEHCAPTKDPYKAF